jgi:hypothetical protein
MHGCVREARIVTRESFVMKIDFFIAYFVSFLFGIHGEELWSSRKLLNEVLDVYCHIS